MADLMETVERVSDHMHRIKSYFKPGVKIAVMVRTPEMPDRDFMLTDDDLDELTAMITRLKAAGEKHP